MEYFESENRKLFFKIIGKGKPLLFLHGFLEDHSIWANVYPTFLENGFQIILVDLPCHGQSRFSGDHCSMGTIAELLHDFLTENKIVNPSVVGHSMGGYVGLALLRLQNINLTLLHSNFWEDSVEKKLDRNRVIEIVKKNKNLFLQEAVPNLFAEQNRVKCEEHIQLLIAKAKEIPTEEICAITLGLRDRVNADDLMKKHKINIIQGEMDKVVPLDLMLKNCTNISQNQVAKIISGVGHMSMFEDQVGLINLLKSILIE